VDDAFGKSILFCSNKRIYLKGLLFERNHQGKIIYSKGQSCVDLKDITGTKFTSAKNLNYFISLTIFLIIGGLLLYLPVLNIGYVSETTIYFFGGLFLLIAFIFLILFYAKRIKYFIIEYAGGEIITKCNWYSDKGLKEFMQNI